MLTKIAPSRLPSQTPSKKRSLGQGMVEYIIITALIAIAAIGVFRLFGDTARNQVAGMATELSGQNGKEQVEAAQTAAGKAQAKAVTERNLGNYNGNN